MLCDLDDTLYPQQAWLDGAWRAVAAAGARYGIEEGAFLAALRADAAEGSGRGGIIDRALGVVGFGVAGGAGGGGRSELRGDVGGSGSGDVRGGVHRDVRGSEMHSSLLAAFRAHRPVRLEPYPGVRAALARLRAAGVRLAVVTDGDVALQEWKVRALGIGAFFDAVVVSDALGGRLVRKPHAAPFREALKVLGVGPERCVVVGDRPEKDVIGAAGVGIRAIRVKTGEYSGVVDPPGVWHSAADFPAAVDWLLAAASGPA